MPFHGVLPERAALFQPQPRADVGVNDAAAWRLNPAHRRVYDKLWLALEVGLIAAPCGVAPADLGLTADTEVFVKPIVNLAGMAVGARALRAGEVPPEPGSFWCERLHGEHTSSDALVRDGEPVWFAHTRASTAKDAERPLYWAIGTDCSALEPNLTAWIRRHLAGYTGLCNLECIGGRPIEAHLRGSNGFFEFYGPEFIPAWVALVDGEHWHPPPPVPGGYVISVFGEGTVTAGSSAEAARDGVALWPDTRTPGRMAVLRCRDLAAGLRVRARLLDASGPEGVDRAEL